MGEVFDDIMEKTHSAEFLRVLRERAGKVTDPQQKEEITEDICTAAIFCKINKRAQPHIPGAALLRIRSNAIKLPGGMKKKLKKYFKGVKI